METPSLPAVFATSLHVTMRRHCYCNLAEVDAEALWLQRHIEGSPQQYPVQALALSLEPPSWDGCFHALFLRWLIGCLFYPNSFLYYSLLMILIGLISLITAASRHLSPLSLICTTAVAGRCNDLVAYRK